MASGSESKHLQSMKYARGKLELLDQTKLPHESAYVDIKDSEAAWHAIHDMVVRGAPAIAIAAALALAVEVERKKGEFSSSEEALNFIQDRLDHLVTSRPTAVNLGIAANALKKVAQDAASGASKTSDDVTSAYLTAAETMLTEDVAANKAIGKYGAQAIEEALAHKKEGQFRVLTHCNTGSLATSSYGTALGVIRSLVELSKLKEAFCTETRPYNQGSRLTAYELVHDGIPATLIADSAAAFLMASGRVDAIVVGADRIAANGDTANKVGTYSLALAASLNSVPFFVCAPLTSVDLDLPAGSGIVIEERSEKELTHALGGRGDRVAPEGIRVWNPSFDVTPAGVITAIITDKGIVRKSPGQSEFDLRTFAGSPALSAASLPLGFSPLSEPLVAGYIQRYPELSSRLGGLPGDWKVREVGDGNMNFVYIVEGPQGALVIKQALPYIRCVGASWPMTLQRASFEHRVLRAHRQLARAHVPEPYFFDDAMGLIAMEYLPPPHVVLRRGLVQGTGYPLLARHLAEYMAATLFHTSLLAGDTAAHRTKVAEFLGNSEMCRLTEQVVFTDPYRVSDQNRWTSPQLDAPALEIRQDAELKSKVAKLKAKFCEQAQALVHGDLHTGSIMVTQTSTYVIDPEFGFYGPIAFDIGAILANLAMAAFSQKGHEKTKGERKEVTRWILQSIADTWNLFVDKFGDLWDQKLSQGGGDSHVASVFDTKETQKVAQLDFFQDLFSDSLGFAGAKIIRRIVGIAHVEDFDAISDADVRADRELRALKFAKRAIKENTRAFTTIEDVVAEIESTLE